jgi:hypothetical protein
MLSNGKWSKGQVRLGGIAIGLILLAVLVIFVVPMMAPVGARSLLEGQGYVVLAAEEYDSLISKIDSIASKADAAVVNAEAAALSSGVVLDKLLLYNENEVFLYPDMASATATLTAGGGADTFGDWAEIVDSGAVTLSSKFSADAGYISTIITRDYSAADKIYIIEIGYGALKTVVGRVKIRSDWTYVRDLSSTRIPTGSTVYYRMRCETGGATLNADFRYYFE